MAVSVFDLFKIGIGPSSSHTVGPMVAARQFAQALDHEGLLKDCCRIQVELFGSLGANGAGHGTPKAIILGLEGETPEGVEVAQIDQRVADVRSNGFIALLGQSKISFSYRDDLLMHRSQSLPFHSNGMRFTAFATAGSSTFRREYYSVGGGFVLNEDTASGCGIVADETLLSHPFETAEQLLAQCDSSGLAISTLMLQNETAWCPEPEVVSRLTQLWQVMDASIDVGCHTEGVMPGGLRVKRRAAHLYRQIKGSASAGSADPLTILDWVTLYALAVNEVNASGGRVVTAPTNGAAGIVPAVLKYYLGFCPGSRKDDIPRFLLTAGAIGILYKTNASISGAEVGCQGEVGAACSMAAAALVDVLGGTPRQVENAAEIAMEHNLGLTCDPVGGLVQVPCIERNAMAAIKAISAARMALRGDGQHYVSLDQVIKTMRDTGRDMQEKYKETARGGLAVNVLAVPVSVIEC